MPDLAFRSAVTIGITTSALVTGINLSQAAISVASLLNPTRATDIPTDVLLSQWTQQFDLAKLYAAPLIITSVISFSYSSFRARRAFRGNAPDPRFLAGAAVALAAMVPFAMLFMQGSIGNVNGQLLDLNKQVNTRIPVTFTEEETSLARSLAEHWNIMCYVRALFPAAASVMGIWALL